MATTGVLRPGHVQLRVMDMEEAVKFYKDVLGLVETGRDGSGRVYFKAWDERDHSSVILQQSDRAGLDHVAFKVLDVATLNKLESDLRAYGVNTERIPAGELLETGERIRFEIPTGHFVDLYTYKKDVGNCMPYTNPVPWVPQTEHGMAPVRLDHLALAGPNVAEAKKLFADVLGFYVTEHVLLEDGINDLAVFMTCSTKVHDIAFVALGNEPGMLHHVAFLQDSWERVLRCADIYAMNGFAVDMGPTRHGVSRGTTVYGFDPSGNRIENFCGGYIPYPDYQPLKWTWDQAGSALLYHDRTLAKLSDSLT